MNFIRPWTRLSQFSLIFAILILTSATLHADVVTWTNGAGGNWNSAANWNSGAGPVPGSGDDAVITLAGTYTVTLDVNATVASLTLGGASGVQTLTSSSHTFTLDGPSTVGAQGFLELVSSTVAGAGPLTNQGTLVVQSGVINAALDNQGQVTWRAGNSQNGALTTASGSVLRVEGNGNITGATLTVANGFTNNGTIDLTAVSAATDANLYVTSGVLVNAAGQAINAGLGAGGPRTLRAALDNHGTVTVSTPLTMDRGGSAHVNESDGTITVSGGDLTLNLGGGSSFTNSGAMPVSTGRTVAVNNGGLILNGTGLAGAGDVQLSGTTATFNNNQSTANTAFTITGSTVNGPGILTNAAGKTLVVQSGVINAALDNQGQVTWRAGNSQNGTLLTSSGSVLRVEGNGNITGATLTVANGFTNNGTIDLTAVSVATDANLYVTSGVLVNAAGQALNAGLGAGGPRTLRAALDNHGTVTVSTPLTMDRGGSAHVNESDGTITVSGGHTLTVTTGTFENAAGGVLAGSGGFNFTNATFTDNGVITPGNSPGQLNITGSIPQGETCVINVELGGTVAGTNYDLLAVSGAMTRDGTLNISLVNGFSPSPGDQFRIITSGPATGIFAHINGLDLGGGLSLEARYDAAGVTLVTVAQTWVRMMPTGIPPQPRDSHSAVYDPTGHRMVVFGGRSDAGPLNDSWVLSDADNLNRQPVWTALATSGATPAARANHTAVYNAVDNRMVVYGGDDATGGTPAMFNDVRVLTHANGVGGSPTWILLSPSGGPPPTRTQHTAVYDQANDVMIVFGGNPSAGSCASGLNDVWVLSHADGVSGTPAWSQLSPTGTPPSARWSHNASYDPASNRMTVFGGDVSCVASNNEVWVLTEANGLGGTPAWIQLSPGGSLPSSWSLHSGAYDAGNNRLTTFGGKVSGSATNQVVTLSVANGLAGSPAWADLSPTSYRPVERTLHTATQDPASHRMTVFAGNTGSARLNDTWVLEQVAGRVVDVTPPVDPVVTLLKLGFSRPIAPNPSNGIARLAISVPSERAVELSIFDLGGRRVASLYRGRLGAGEHQFEWRGDRSSAAPAASGVYLVRFRSEEFTQVRRLLLVR